MAETAPTDEIDPGTGPEPIKDPDNPKSARGWLSLIEQAEVQFRRWQEVADGVERQYADLDRLSGTTRDRQFQLFWANTQVLGPSIYSRPPVPVVVPRFKDGNAVARTASELLERSIGVMFETQDLDGVLRQVRDDLNIIARGVTWARYESNDDDDDLGQRVCIEWVERRDFVHDPARTWKDSDWVAKRSWLTEDEARKRFKKHSDDAYRDAAYEVQKDAFGGKTDIRLKAGFWELWSKSKNKVVWVAEGCEDVLDEREPHLKLQDFFPSPRPALGTVQRNSLVPVPDMLFYKDQLEEINEITARISALTQAVRLKGFYPAGAGEIADAVEAAIKSNDDNAVLIGVSNWSLLGNGSAKDLVVWLPIADVVAAIQSLIAERKELINDVYEIMGLSDIMRGQTEASETLGAQQLKSQYGSVRIRDKQSELVRIARDLTRIAGEIMAENFTGKSLLDLSQMELPTDAEVAKQVAPIKKQMQQIAAELKQAQASPEAKQLAQQNPEQAQQILGQAQHQLQQLQQQIDKANETVTIDKVMKFLRDNRVRAFTLDIETDSTIQPDEQAQKQQVTEYATALGSVLQQALPVVKEVPQAAPLLAAIIKKVNSVYRVGRDFEQVVEEFTTQMQQVAATPPPQGPTPEQIQQQTDAAKAQQDAQLAGQKAQIDGLKVQLQGQKQQTDAQLAQADLALKRREAELEAQIADKDREIERYKIDVDAATKINVAQISAQTANNADALAAKVEQEAGLVDNAHEAQMQAEQHEHEAATQQADQQHQAQMQEAAAAQQAAQQQQEPQQ